jgi:hypothetical protein
MAPHRKTTEDQTEYLKAWVPEYLDAQKRKRLPHFWPKYYRSWFEQYSERTLLYGDRQDLTAEEEEALGTAIQKRQTVSFDLCFTLYDAPTSYTFRCCIIG